MLLIAVRRFVFGAIVFVLVVIVFDCNVTDRLGMSAQVSYDLVSSASIGRPGNFPGQPGAITVARRSSGLS